MPLLSKARQIWRTHGVRGFAQRAARYVRRTLAARADAAAQRSAWDRLIAHAGHGRPVYFPKHEKPVVSIIVPVYNRLRHTAVCLNAVLRQLSSIPCEVIVVDDGSTDGTVEYLDSCSGIRVIRHDENLGFVQSVNDGADVARGRYLHLLNNDTIVLPGWMPSLIRTFESRDNVAAVGSQLRAPDRSISEAGALVWRDGNTARFMRGRAPSDPGAAFPREVDYCSGASLMIRSDVFRELGGLSPEFAPAYYEDVDLCFRIRAAGYRVLYQPDSVVVHFEDVRDSEKFDNAKHVLPLHRHIFAEKWRSELSKHFPPDVELIDRAARRLAGKRTALVIDSFIPFDDRSAGGRRLLAIMRLMRELGWHVIFVADDGGAYEPYTTRTRRAGIEVITHRGDAAGVIGDIPVTVDVAWVSRPDLLQKYMPHLRRRTKCKIIYDTVDLHFLRLEREAAQTGLENGWQVMRELEYSLTRKTDCTIVTSEAERELLAQAGIASCVVPIIEDPIQTHTAYSARSDVLFLANYTHEPNVDAAAWLVHEIMPRVWERIPNMHLTLAGAEPTPLIKRFANERVSVTGHVPDVRALFENARVFVAPMRFGAGMKGKIVQSLAHCLPVVTTSIGAEGIGLRDGESAIIADDLAGMVEGILRLYTDENLWIGIAAQSRQISQQFTPSAVRARLEAILTTTLEPEVQVGIDAGLSTHSA